MIYLESIPGALVAVPGEGTTRPIPAYIEGIEAFGLGRVLFTAVDYEGSVLGSVRPSLDRTSHAYSAGMAPGQFVAKGLLAIRTCERSRSGLGPFGDALDFIEANLPEGLVDLIFPPGQEVGPSGIEAVLAYFNQVSMANRLEPLAVSLGGRPEAQFQAFLLNVHAGGMISGDGIATGRFELAFQMLPNA